MAQKDHKSGKLSGFVRWAKGVAKAFGKDVWEKFWDELTKTTARIIIILLAVGLLGGYTLFDRIKAWQEQQRERVERCLEGRVVDGLWGNVIDSVYVGIVGIGEATSVTDAQGKFRICFDLPKNQETVDLSFNKKGYVPDIFHEEAILIDNKTGDYRKNYVLNPDHSYVLELER